MIDENRSQWLKSVEPGSPLESANTAPGHAFATTPAYQVRDCEPVITALTLARLEAMT